MKTTHKAWPHAPGTDVRSPLKPMSQAPISEPEPPNHKSPHGQNPAPDGAAHARKKKAKKDGQRRPRNKGRA